MPFISFPPSSFCPARWLMFLQGKWYEGLTRSAVRSAGPALSAVGCRQRDPSCRLPARVCCCCCCPVLNCFCCSPPSFLCSLPRPQAPQPQRNNARPSEFSRVHGINGRGRQSNKLSGLRKEENAAPRFLSSRRILSTVGPSVSGSCPTLEQTATKICEVRSFEETFIQCRFSHDQQPETLIL